MKKRKTWKGIEKENENEKMKKMEYLPETAQEHDFLDQSF